MWEKRDEYTDHLKTERSNVLTAALKKSENLG